MSADNGIYIGHFPDGWRVTHAQAIENIDYYPEGSAERKQELKEYFGKSKLYPSLDEAYQKALEIESEIANSEFPILEYGICILGKLEAFD